MFKNTIIDILKIILRITFVKFAIVSPYSSYTGITLLIICSASFLLE